MSLYLVEALNGDHQFYRTSLEADSWQQLNDELKRKGHIALSIKEHQTRLHAPLSTWFRAKRASTATLMLFCNQLATLLEAEVPMAKALQVIAKQVTHKRAQTVIFSLYQQVFEGQSLSQSARQQQGFFDSMICEAIAAGESAGILVDVLKGIAAHCEQREQVNQKVQQALLYPFIMVTVSLCVMGFLLAYVMPKIIPLFKTTHQHLPLATRILLGTIHFLRVDWWILLLLGAGLIGMVMQIKTQLRWRLGFDKICLRLPGVRRLLLLTDTTRFLGTLAFLLQAGVPLMKALQAATSLVANGVIKQALEVMAEKVLSGVPLSEGLAQTAYFTDLTLSLIRAGEQSGALAKQCQQAADYHRRELLHAINLLLTLFEPVMILVMGGMVLFIVLAVLLPIFSLDQLVHLT